MVESSTNDTVLASRGASKNSRADLTITAFFDGSRLQTARASGSGIQTIDVIVKRYHRPRHSRISLRCDDEPVVRRAHDSWHDRDCIEVEAELDVGPEVGFV